jgi:hypothetical protein
MTGESKEGLCETRGGCNGVCGPQRVKAQDYFQQRKRPSQFWLSSHPQPGPWVAQASSPVLGRWFPPSSTVWFFRVRSADRDHWLCRINWGKECFDRWGTKYKFELNLVSGRRGGRGLHSVKYQELEEERVTVLSWRWKKKTRCRPPEMMERICRG